MSPHELAHLGGLPFHPGVGVGGHKRSGVDGLEAAGAGEEAQEGGVRDRRGGWDGVSVMVAVGVGVEARGRGRGRAGIRRRRRGGRRREGRGGTR